MTMKKAYIRPASATVRMETEAPIMAASVRIEKGEGYATGDEALNNKYQGGWSSEDWSGAE